MLDQKKSKLLLDKINQYQNIIIAKHKQPDWDAQGSAIGLANIINDNFKNKTIYVVGDRISDDDSFLIDESNLSDEFIKSSLIITVDTATKKRVDFDRFDLCKDSFKVDHHINVENYCNNDLIDDTSIANTQVVSLWAIENNLFISKTAAHNLYLGLLTDSNRFLYDKTNAVTFYVASRLLQAGANLKKANDFLYVSDLKLRQWMMYIFSKMKLTDSGIAYIVLLDDDLKDWNLEYEEIKLALSVMSGVKEIKIWFTIIQVDDILKVSLRSRDYAIDKIANKYNGGGHKLASGAEINSLDQINDLINDLEQLIKGE
ncbi:DHH family protein [Mycoplasma feriruminatoris]|uniref:DHH family phosphoesterase n=1 Tax=Mycoplasma feriruminatoris TaxID=1179777 RepID=UPI00241C415D|nr:bifunctional oligoribonuclease/PAP phosphatase NrnA [Mycoplasma feriruminatoris]WFQ90724.1 DHH family protein [Mycoplasma feriruminatoris]